MVGISTLISSLQTRDITELFKNAGASLTDTFLIVKVENVSFESSRGSWADLYKYTLTLQYP